MSLPRRPSRCAGQVRVWHGFQLGPEEGSRICPGPKHLPPALMLELRAHPKPSRSQTFLEGSSNPSVQMPQHPNLAKPPKVLCDGELNLFPRVTSGPQWSPGLRTLGMVGFSP